MLTTSFLPACLARKVSRQIDSDATAEPPGLSMRNRIARTELVALGKTEGADHRVGARSRLIR